MKEQIVLGIDPGTNILGYCILIYNNNKYDILEIGSFKTKPTLTHLEKLEKIVNFIATLFDKYKPDIMAIEEPFYGKNVQSMLKLGRVQGVVMAIALQHKLEISEISPRRVKQAVTGKGAASKEQVASMVSSIIGYKIDVFDTDATDAAAIAIAHTLQRFSTQKENTKKQTKKSSWAQFIMNNPNKVV